MLDALARGLWGRGGIEVIKEEGGEEELKDVLGPQVKIGVETEGGGGVEEGEGDEEREEDAEIGLGRGVAESDSGFVPGKGGAEQGGGGEERKGVIGISLGRGVCVSTVEGVGEECVVCFGGEEAAEGMYAAVGVGTVAV